MLLENTIHLGDCFELMKEIPSGSVDMVLCDLPYGTTQNAWDSILPLEKLWLEYFRITKENAPIVLFSAQPFTSKLVSSNYSTFKYCWVWEKSHAKGFLNAWKQPLRKTEDICVFYRKPCLYNPQIMDKPIANIRPISSRGQSSSYGKFGSDGHKCPPNKTMPVNILRFNSQQGTVHPTQKPVALFEYLIKTYTNPGDLVLDNCAGSGTTAVACKQTGRRYLCIEKGRDYWLKACERVNQSNGFGEVSSLASQTVLDHKTEPPLA